MHRFTDLVDGISDGKVGLAFAPQLASVFLHESNHHRAAATVIVSVAAGDGHIVLRVRPECSYSSTQLYYYYYY